ncbi:hypothetical protein [Vibrio quintilis]|uniref:Uncharacterized protein n=1 Tax=Vibrio quintilis TaxID=1117707 RepID=A0A1M7YQ44_9VIBR|nr:hypothetical protein [Vibrio quintilis]SHO54730.1 hypothetical protein VQ7734_00446 [Vibrio quintilis]
MINKLILILSIVCFQAKAFVSEDSSFQSSADIGAFGQPVDLYFDQTISRVPENQQEDIPSSHWSLTEAGGTFVLAELTAAALSGLAAKDPEATGWGLIAISPLMTDAMNVTTGTVGFVSVAAIGAYNLSIDEDEKSESDIFTENMIAWNAAFVTMGVTEYLFPGFTGNLAVYPDLSGNWYMNYQFKF